ncbi:hypothetical protein TRFO_08161 [Tritrichomonas foetus]|uniref:Uncharacterized protein n=1 Tax=Tritrichomonas foetus TaxID=1144522 RepID=A0A1J4JLA3_9EUKA|nr:hypothetical protein TRFO_08161 [Tritrichomonas foetus]|eukprot:OHS99866.1 hypothetical protein TRFO_08161 [Tritrichomonas foetus]
MFGLIIFALNVIALQNKEAFVNAEASTTEEEESPSTTEIGETEDATTESATEIGETEDAATNSATEIGETEDATTDPATEVAESDESATASDEKPELPSESADSQTDEPADSQTKDPVESQTNEPAESQTNEPAESQTNEPVDPTDKPVDPTDKPVDPTDKPVDPTDKPVDPTDKPVDPTDKPVDPTDKPVDPTDKPVDPTDKPVDPTDKPVDPSKPVEDASSTPDEVTPLPTVTPAPPPEKDEVEMNETITEENKVFVIPDDLEKNKDYLQPVKVSSIQVSGKGENFYFKPENEKSLTVSALDNETEFGVELQENTPLVLANSSIALNLKTDKKESTLKLSGTEDVTAAEIGKATFNNQKLTLESQVDVTLSEIYLYGSSQLQVNGEKSVSAKALNLAVGSQVTVNKLTVKDSLNMELGSSLDVSEGFDLTDADVSVQFNDNFALKPAFTGTLQTTPKSLSFTNYVSPSNVKLLENTTDDSTNYVVVSASKFETCEDWRLVLNYTNSVFKSSTCTTVDGKTLLTVSSADGSSNLEPESGGLSSGAIAGIVIAVIVVIVIVVIVVIFVKKKKDEYSSTSYASSELEL